MASKVRGRSNHSHSHDRADADGDHVLRDLFAKADTRVVTSRDDVGKAIIDNDLNLDVRMVRQKAPQCRLQDGNGRMLAGRYANDPCRLAPQFAQCRQFGIVKFFKPRHAVGYQRPVPNDGRKSHGIKRHGRSPQIGRMAGRDDIDAVTDGAMPSVGQHTTRLDNRIRLESRICDRGERHDVGLGQGRLAIQREGQDAPRLGAIIDADG